MIRTAYVFPIIMLTAWVHASGLQQAAGAPAGDRPNILWITCEDISPNLGCFGDAYARTENLDRLAARGIRYTNAFAPIGVCAPARSTLITGVWPTELGTHNMRCEMEIPATIHGFPAYLRRAGYYCTNNSKTDYNFKTPRDAWDESGRKAHWRKRKPGQPFFSVFNITTTHESQIRLPDDEFARRTARLRSDQRHDPASVPVPPIHPDTPEVRRDWARYHDLITAMDIQAGDLLADLQADGLADDTIVFFFSDHGAGMPGYKRWLWDSGIHVPLIVHIPERYRDLATDPPGSATDRMVSFIDFAPTVLSLAGVPIPEHMDGHAFLGRAQAPPQEFIYAFRDRMDGRYDCIRAVRGKRYHYIRNFMPQLTYAQYMAYQYETPTMQVWQRLADEGKLVGPQRRYFAPTKPTEELYDAAEDPNDIHNLAGDPKHAEVLEHMRAELFRWMTSTRDLGLMPEYEIALRSEGTTPYEMRLDPAKYPFKRVLQAARLASDLNPAAIPELELLLRDEDSVVRYWAATGLGALGDKAENAAGLLIAALADPAPNVRVAAADALCRLNQCDPALPTLAKALKNDSPFIRLRALNVLDNLGEPARLLLPSVRQVSTDAPEAKHFTRYIERAKDHIISSAEK